MVSLRPLFLIEDNGNILDAVKSVKALDGLRPSMLFVKIREVLVVQDEGKENRIYPIDGWVFLAVPRNSCCDKGRGSEGNSPSQTTGSEMEKRTRRLFYESPAFSSSSSRQKQF
jgi:hypothetical protein